MMKQDEYLMTSRRFVPMFFTQFFGALNDNVFKQALLLVITYGWIQQQSAPVSTLNNLAALLFILPYFFFFSHSWTNRRQIRTISTRPWY